jgi:hypothetical protein
MIRLGWDYGLTPQVVVRIGGRWGFGPVQAYVTRRFTLGPASAEAQEEFNAQQQANTANNNNKHNSNNNNNHHKNKNDNNNVNGHASDHNNDDVDRPGRLMREESNDDAAESMFRQIDIGNVALNKADLAEYLYHLIAAPGSGEYALNRLISTDVFARHPLQERLPSLAKHKPAVDVTFIYGSPHDWMPVSGGRATAKSIEEAGGKADVLTVSESGHQLMIDNPSGFHTQIQKAIDY